MAYTAHKTVIPLEKLCRCCLQVGRVMRPFFVKEETDTGPMIAVKFNECSASKIAVYDGYPQFICQPCVVLLDAAFMFREISAKSDKKMRSMAPFEVLTGEEQTEVLEPPPIEMCFLAEHFWSDEDYTADNSLNKPSDYWAQDIKPSDLLEIKIEADDQLVISKETIHCSPPKKPVTKSHSAVHTLKPPAEPVASKPPYRRKSRALLPRKHQCDVCGASSKSATNLRDHRRTHFPPENPVTCDLCQKQFTTKGSIVVHMRTHTGERPYMCEICGRAFRNSADVNKHQAVHTGERNFPCKQCTYRAGTRANLLIHERIHSGALPFACPHCPQKFRAVSNQKKHIRHMHEGSDEYKCKCGLRCSSSATLRQHINRHLGLKPYDCPGCTMKYSYYTALTKHARVHHPDLQLPKEWSYPKPVFDEEAVKRLSKQPYKGASATKNDNKGLTQMV